MSRILYTAIAIIARTHRNWFMNPNTSLFKTILDTIIPPRGASLLDVGCGDGAFLRYLHSSRNDLKLTGIDLSENQSQDGVDFIQGDFLETTFTDSFDIVTSLAVIEHVVDIQLFSRRIVQCCRPGGVVVLMTLNDDGLLYRVSRLLHRVGFSAAFNRLYSKHHLNHFSPQLTRHATYRAGFNPAWTKHAQCAAQVD